MSMIEIKRGKDEYNREVITYVDTDELSDEEYYKYRELERNGKRSEVYMFIKNILK